MDKEFLKAFTEIVREQVAHKAKVRLDGVGTFSPEHRKQYQQQYQDGRVVMMPPEDRIEFIPDSKLKNDN